MTIFVGSTNPVKVNAVTTASSETWPDVVVEGVEVESGIPDQPKGDEQTRQGAVNRAKASLMLGLEKLNGQGNDNKEYLGVGMEGGVMKIDGELWSTVWVAVIDEQNQVFESNGARFKVPQLVADRINNGEEMGPIMADIVQEADVRKKQGMIGVITRGFVDRTEEYMGIVKMALGLWYGRNWENNQNDKL